MAICIYGDIWIKVYRIYFEHEPHGPMVSWPPKLRLINESWLGFQHETKKAFPFLGRKTLPEWMCPFARSLISIRGPRIIYIWAGTCITHQPPAATTYKYMYTPRYLLCSLAAAFCTTRSCNIGLRVRSNRISAIGCTYLVPNLSYSRDMRFQQYIGNRANLIYTSHHLYLSCGVNRFTTSQYLAYIPRF